MTQRTNNKHNNKILI